MLIDECQRDKRRFNDKVAKKPENTKRDDSLLPCHIYCKCDNGCDSEYGKKSGNRVDQGIRNGKIVIAALPHDGM